jgi:hypothetical protein
MHPIKKRWNAKESRLGKFLKRELALFLLLCSIVGGANEYLILIPSDWIPIWIKEMVPIMGLISYVAGKLTKEKEDGRDDDQSA